MNVLGVTFDSKLNWQAQIENTVCNSKKALHAIYLIRKYFSKNKLLKIINSNYCQFAFHIFLNPRFFYIDPKFNAWDTAKPWMEEYIKKEYSYKNIFLEKFEIIKDKILSCIL